MREDLMLPFVSVLTPTFNRRIFIEQLLRNFWRQTYPPEKMELIVLDDGEDSVADLLEGKRGVNYIRLPERIPLGRKRNMLGELARGEILVHMDDDDYYPPGRVAHAVKMLQRSEKLLAGSSEMFICDLQEQKIYRSGPFGPNHGTNGTFAYKKAYLLENRFDDEVIVRDEALFTRDFTNPMVQLDPRQTILCISHGRNNWDKNKATQKGETPLKLKEMVLCKDALRFYRYKLPKLLFPES